MYFLSGTTGKLLTLFFLPQYLGDIEIVLSLKINAWFFQTEIVSKSRGRSTIRYKFSMQT